MKYVGIIAGKGGTGKTTIALALSALFAQNGTKTALIDLDGQKSATMIINNLPDKNDHKISFEATEETEIAVIDYAPSAIDLDDEIDFAIFVTRPNFVDLAALHSSVLNNTKAKKLIDANRYVIVFNQFNDSRSEQNLIDETVGVYNNYLIIDDHNSLNWVYLNGLLPTQKTENAFFARFLKKQESQFNSLYNYIKINLTLN